MSTIEAFELVKAKLMEQTGSVLTDEQVQEYLILRRQTPEQWLEWDADLSASIVNVPLRIPDKEKDPEGYQHYVDSQYLPELELAPEKGKQ